MWRKAAGWNAAAASNARHTSYLYSVHLASQNGYRPYNLPRVNVALSSAVLIRRAAATIAEGSGRLPLA